MIRSDIADVGKGEGDDLPGVRRVRQDLLVPGDGGVEADLADRGPNGAKALAPEYAAVRENERGVAVGRSIDARILSGVVLARCSLPGRLRTPRANSDVGK